MEQNYTSYLIRIKEAQNKHQQLDDCHLVQKMTDMEKMFGPKDGKKSNFVQLRFLISGSHLF